MLVIPAMGKHDYSLAWVLDQGHDVLYRHDSSHYQLQLKSYILAERQKVRAVAYEPQHVFYTGAQ